MMTMVMRRDRIYTATRLKAELLGVLDAVEATGEEVVVTKHGRAVARVVPVTPPAPLVGSVSFLVGSDELLAPLDVAWDAEQH